MVRLVFRPYSQVRRSICTSEPLRASTRVSSGFTLPRNSSPSFGSQHACSHSDPSRVFKTGRCCTVARWHPFTFIAPVGLPPKDSHACWTPWSVFQDGSFETISSASLAPVKGFNCARASKPDNQHAVHPVAAKGR